MVKNKLMGLMVFEFWTDQPTFQYSAQTSVTPSRAERNATYMAVQIVISLSRIQSQMIGSVRLGRFAFFTVVQSALYITKMEESLQRANSAQV